MNYWPNPLSEEMLYQGAKASIWSASLSVAAPKLGCSIPDTAKFDATVQGFAGFLEAVGVSHFPVEEIITPNDKAKAFAVGYTVLLPPKHMWPVCGLLLWLCEEIRTLVQEPVQLRNVWRPYRYNQKVASSGIDSDHPNACGADLDFKSSPSRAKAEGWIRAIFKMVPQLSLSLGVGRKTLHIGILSPQGSRIWWYGSHRFALDKRGPLR